MDFDETTDAPMAADPMATAPMSAEEPEAPENEKALVKRLQAKIRGDKKHHEKAFDRMRRDMFVAMHGYVDGEYPASSYKANIAGRHIQQKTASLYAKNPKAVARRRETLDFTVWDESPQSLEQAMVGLQMGQQALLPGVDEATGLPVEAPGIPEHMQEAFAQAQAVMQDFQRGMQRRQMIQKTGKTLEILFAQALREQKPVDFKTAAKQLVRRACTTGVGYTELGFQRETGPRPAMSERLADFRARLDHLKRLSADATESEIEQDDAEMAELEASIMALQSEPEVVLREGLIFDFPQSTKVIPDKMCHSLVGFIGARHLTIEYLFTTDEIEEMFGVDLKQDGYKGYSADGKSAEDVSEANTVPDDADEDDETRPNRASKSSGLVCVWKHYDKPSGLVYYLAHGHDKFLRPAAAPDVFVEDFWPVYALTFNACESETELFPPSDVALMLDQQSEYNRSRQGMREHRNAARPRWVYANGALEDEDIEGLKSMKPFDALGINMAPGQSLADVLGRVEVPGVDPNLYETGQLFTDIQLVVGAQEAQLGGVSQATATESAIAASSSASSSGSSVDDLDAFLTMLARASGQILLREMSEEQVKEVAGPGAVWPHLSLAEIASEVFLEVEAGSTGKPNEQVELAKWERLAPFLIQIPGINPVWMAREFIRRLDDRVDITEALSSGVPSIVMQNQMQQPGTGDAATDPKAQGNEGASNGPPAPGGPGGSGPAFGSNQV
ncbi:MULTISPECIES: hypothetical protein [unclassified Aurantimonas]|uniref:hypothetical protein n=1 Tax=unclassified Aurantimonas TaxID=2638230 RepID=UPI002E1861AD|nr:MULTISPECIES: hypothetical protein [unclassified Aurantimonas]MEC5291583.1 hypothetical protein [Aurantimonas sp. C2-3-R2]MEC5412667.1 hypothetical protein [Aurantimonas sp. C2-4-R8]